MIQNILHLSDIHIRTGDLSKARYNEYIASFDNLYVSLSEQPSIISNSAVIVITGDIFHDKNKIGPSGIKIATYLLQKLSSLATVYIIRGNHDYRQDHPTELDMISALMSYDIPNVIYLDKIGIHTYGNISFGLVAIQATLLYGSTSGISSDLPAFPNPSTENIKNNYKIALFHGTIKGSTLQNGSKTTISGYPIDWFQGYDAILLGDIHLQQIGRATLIENTTCTLPYTTSCHTYSYTNESPWGYPGSLIQQDFGEPIKGHGYILWNLQNKTISTYHLKNNYGMIKIIYNGNIEDLDIEYKQYIKPITKFAKLNKIITTKWFPDNVHIRVYGDNVSSEILRLITEKIQSYNKNVLTITKKYNNIVAQPEPTLKTDNVSSDIVNINSIDNLINYIDNKITKDNKTISSNVWKQWLQHPESIIIPTTYIPNKILPKIIDKSATIEKLSQKYIEEFDKVQAQQIISGNLHINKLEWNWILNYKKGNVFDFDNNSKNISVINAKNGNGKSNFLEIMCIALFGQGFPSRHNTNYAANIICDKKPSGVMASTNITFTLNNILYNITRAMRHNTTKRNINFEDVVLCTIINGSKTILHQKNNAVSQWVDSHIGTIDTYLMSAMLSQNADSDFFSLSHKEQKELLDRILSLDHITSLEALLTKSVKYYKDTSELIESYYDGVTQNIRVVEQKYIDELQVHKLELDKIVTNIATVYDKWNMISEKVLNNVDITTLNIQITNIQSRLNTLDSVSDINKNASKLDRSINNASAELIKYHSFSDIDNSDNKNLDNSNNSDNKNIIDALKTKLDSHPFYKNTKYNLYESFNNIVSKINVAYKNNSDDNDLLKYINEFETWNKIHIKQFALDTMDSKYYQNTSEIDELKNNINSLITIINQYPDKILSCTKHITKLRKGVAVLHKETEHCSDKRPNKPSKTVEWLNSIQQTIVEYGDVDELINLKAELLSFAKQIPVLCNTLSNIAVKISEHNQYILECSALPFNPDCEACKKQPWRTKYDIVVNDLPIMIKTQEGLLKELAALQYEGVGFELSLHNYKNYIQDLEGCVDITSQIINDIRFYNSEKVTMDKWITWRIEYIDVKRRYDLADNELQTAEKDKDGLDKTLHKSTIEKQTMQNKLETIQTKIQEYNTYINEFGIRSAEADMCLYKLEYNWYSTLHEYRGCIAAYLKHLNGVILVDTGRRREYEAVFKERCGLEDEFNTLLLIKEVYPYWIEWKQMSNSAKGLSLTIRELETQIGGSTSGSLDGSITAVMLLLDTIKQNIDIMSYIATSFKGYREWLYKEHIGSLIQKKVNDVLEIICDDRPLYLECDWLDKIDTLSWFVRDGNSRPIIEKASGFQRFIVGIAMRVAINQLGLSRVRFSEFFIDEGFTACDADNLEKVPEFLRGLLRFYDSIYLATHLDELKGCADKHIFIERDADGLSLIQYGDVDMINDVEDATKNRKRGGRPPKESVVVTKV